MISRRSPRAHRGLELTAGPDVAYSKGATGPPATRRRAGRRASAVRGPMSNGEDSGADIGFKTARGRDWPSVRQFNVFLANRVGALLHVVRQFETTDIRIVSLTVVESADCAIIRIVLSDPERALEIFERAKLPVTESDLLVVQLPEGRQPLLQICKALLGAEISIHYAYPLMIGPHGSPALALCVDDHETAVQNLAAQGFTLSPHATLPPARSSRPGASPSSRAADGGAGGGGGRGGGGPFFKGRGSLAAVY